MKHLDELLININQSIIADKMDDDFGQNHVTYLATRLPTFVTFQQYIQDQSSLKKRKSIKAEPENLKAL